MQEGEELKQLRNDIATTEKNLKTMKKMLEEGEKKCPHIWGQVRFTPTTIPGYFSPARGCGSDFQPSMNVPAETIKKWTRVCTICGKEETTTKTKFEGKEMPVFESDKQWGY